MRDPDRVDTQRLLLRVGISNARRHRFKLTKGKFYETRYFKQRVADAWNALPGEVIEADMLAKWKRHLDRHINR